MNCCPHCQGADKLFNEDRANSNLQEYRRHGPDKTTKRLLEAIESNEVTGMTLLDIGGGIGVIQHELARAGVSAVTDVDASASYLMIAQQEATRRGYAAEARYLHGDFVAMADQVEPADIVTMNRVICCYPFMEALVGAAAARAKRYLGVVYPRETWWTKMGIVGLNTIFSLWGNPFRNFVHPTAAVEQVIADNGLQQISHQDGLLWQVAVFAR